MKDRNSRLRIIVLGFMVGGPLGGFAWPRMQYVMGLSRLGHEVYFLEDSNDYASCYDPVRDVMDRDPTYGLNFVGRFFSEVGLDDRWAYYDAHASQWAGPRAGDMPELCRSSDLLVHVSGKSVIRPWLMAIPAKIFVDLDPVFTQVKHLTDEMARERAALHSAFLTVGENIGSSGSSIPDDGFVWQPTRAPIVLDMWPVTPGPARGKYTSVMNWDSYSPCEYGGRSFGMKSASFAPFMDLPQKCGADFELAMGSASAPKDELRDYGWRIVDPREPTRTPWTYQDYIRHSKGEFGIAKHGYVVTRSGWFSERSAKYLASGRPVVVQETGFSDWLDVDMGVKSFGTPDEASAAIDDINSRYDAHCRAAREVAAEFFDHRRILPRLIDQALG